MRDLREYLSMPWHVRRKEHDDDGWYASLEIDELPGFVVAARTDDELDRMFWAALQSYLKSYLDDGEEPPLPAVVRQSEQVALEDAPEPVVVSGSTVQRTEAHGHSTGFPWQATVNWSDRDLELV